MRLSIRWVSVVAAIGTIGGAGGFVLAQDGPAAVAAQQISNDLCIVAPPTPYNPASGRSMLAPRSIPATARCPVCGMYPARSPRWAAQIIFKDGAAHFFDSPINLFIFLGKVERYNKGYSVSDVAARYVTDFATGQSINAERAIFVHGSNALGPMRDSDLPAFAERQAAVAFARIHGGKVLGFGQVTPDVLQTLNRIVHHRH